MTSHSAIGFVDLIPIPMSQSGALWMVWKGSNWKIQIVFGQCECCFSHSGESAINLNAMDDHGNKQEIHFVRKWHPWRGSP